MQRQRRLLNVGVVGLAVSTLVLTGCSSPNNDKGSEPEGTQGGEAVYAIDTPLNRLDPNSAGAAQDARVFRQAFDNLVALQDGKFYPYLAKSWEISPDGKEYTFKLRDDVTFWDDSKFNAEAVCFNFDRIKDPATTSYYAVTLLGPYASCTAKDETTAVVTLGAPYAPFLSVLSSPFLGMVSPTAAKAVPVEDFVLKPVGSGPFIIESYVPQDRVVMVANEKYNWGPENATHQGRAYLDKLTIQIVSDATVRLGSVQAGQVQAIGNVPEVNAQMVKDDASLNYYSQAQSGSPFQLNFNTSRAPFNDLKVREAVRLGFDVETAVKTLYLGTYPRAWTALSPTTRGYDKSLEGSFKYDKAAAEKMLDDAGWKMGSDGFRAKDGKRLTLVYIEGAVNREKRQDIAEFFKANMKEIGVDVDIKLGQTAEIQSALQNADYDIAGLSFVNVDANMMQALYSPQFMASPGKNGQNFSRVDDAKLAKTLLDAQQEQDQSKRDKLYAEAQKMVIDLALSVGVYVPSYTMATKGITGLRFDTEGYPVWYDVSLAK